MSSLHVSVQRTGPRTQRVCAQTCSRPGAVESLLGHWGAVQGPEQGAFAWALSVLRWAEARVVGAAWRGGPRLIAPVLASSWFLVSLARQVGPVGELIPI